MNAKQQDFLASWKYSTGACLRCCCVNVMCGFADDRCDATFPGVLAAIVESKQKAIL